jgi:hypothetical protein
MRFVLTITPKNVARYMNAGKRLLQGDRKARHTQSLSFRRSRGGLRCLRLTWYAGLFGLRQSSFRRSLSAIDCMLPLMSNSRHRVWMDRRWGAGRSRAEMTAGNVASMAMPLHARGDNGQLPVELPGLFFGCMIELSTDQLLLTQDCQVLRFPGCRHRLFKIDFPRTERGIICTRKSQSLASKSY